jgi:hypothetical protein
LGAVEQATAEAAKHGDRSEPLALLVAQAKGMIEQAKTEQAERARAAAEEAAAAAAEKAAAEEAVEAERQQLEERAALTLRMQTRRTEDAADALQLQQVQAKLGSGSGTSHPDAEETQCVVCFDAPKDHIIVPCGHIYVCVRRVRSS